MALADLVDITEHNKNIINQYVLSRRNIDANPITAVLKRIDFMFSHEKMFNKGWQWTLSDVIYLKLLELDELVREFQKDDLFTYVSCIRKANAMLTFIDENTYTDGPCSENMSNDITDVLFYAYGKLKEKHPKSAYLATVVYPQLKPFRQVQKSG